MKSNLFYQVFQNELKFLQVVHLGKYEFSTKFEQIWSWFVGAKHDFTEGENPENREKKGGRGVFAYLPSPPPPGADRKSVV